MKLRLHEIERGTDNVAASAASFQNVLGLPPGIRQEGLTVFDSEGLDFNLSNHLPQGVICVSFFTDDLPEIDNRLKGAGIAYEGLRLPILA